MPVLSDVNARKWIWKVAILCRFQSNISKKGRVFLMIKSIRRLVLCLAIVVGIVSAKGGGNDSLEVVRLRAKVDSLVNLLSMTKYEETVNAKAFQSSVDNLNSHVNWMVGGLCTLMAGVFSFLAIYVLVQLKLKKDEAKHIRKSIEDKVLEGFNSEAKGLKDAYKANQDSFLMLEASVKLRTEEASKTIDTKIAGIDSRYLQDVQNISHLTRISALIDVYDEIGNGPALFKAWIQKLVYTIVSNSPTRMQDILKACEGIIYTLETYGGISETDLATLDSIVEKMKEYDLDMAYRLKHAMDTYGDNDHDKG